MDKKIVSGSVKELNEKGEGAAVIATKHVVDKDGDVTLDGAFGEQIVSVVPAHNWLEAPIGKASVRETEKEVVASFVLNLKTDLGRNWYEALKFDLEHPPTKQEYSYGFSVVESENGDFEGQQVRFLKKLKVHEISPVLLGAGIGTRTLALKDAKGQEDLGLQMAEQLALSIEYLENTVGRLEEIRDIRAKGGRKLSKERLEDVVRLRGLISRIDELLAAGDAMKTSEGIAAGYFELRRKLAAQKSLTVMDNR